MTRVGHFRRWQQRASYVIGALLITLAVGAYYRHVWPTYQEFSRSVDASCMIEYCDFTLYYHKQARVIRSSDTPVKKYFYSPTFALLLTPLGKLSKADAQAAWTWVQAASVLLLLAASLLCLRGFSPGLHALLLLLTLTSYPLLHNHKWGQANTTFIALIVLALALIQRGWIAPAALSLSLAVACRYYPIMYALCFLTRGRYRGLLWLGTACVLLLVAWPVLALGAEHALHFYRESQRGMQEANSTWLATISSSQYLPSTFARAARAFWHKRDIGGRALWVSIAGAVGLCNLALALLLVRKRIAHDVLWAFCCIALSTPLLLPTSWMHYFVYLPLVQTFTLAQLFSLCRRWWLRALALALLWLPSVVLPSVFFYLHIGNTGQYSRTGYLLFANLAQLLLVYALVLLSSTRPESKRRARTEPWRTGTSE